MGEPSFEVGSTGVGIAGVAIEKGKQMGYSFGAAFEMRSSSSSLGSSRCGGGAADSALCDEMMGRAEGYSATERVGRAEGYSGTVRVGRQDGKFEVFTLNVPSSCKG